ncbi:MAG: cobalamin B12-binding domain-containing protein [Candidatus Thorarchaeota archaeon]|jgi:5-methyltetrahydrofolate--homocysteine methyltransferase
MKGKEFYEVHLRYFEVSRDLENLERLRNAIVEGEPDIAENLAKGVLDSGGDVLNAINNAVVPGINQAGELWKQNKYFISDVVMCGEAFKSAMNVLEKDHDIQKREKIGKYLICTVEGDMHDLGKSIVMTMLKGAGFEVIDLGVNVPIATFIEKTRELRPDIVGLGAYMSTTASTLKDYVQALEDNGLRDDVKVMMGGVRTSEEYIKKQGADAWGRDGIETAEKALKLMGVQS